MSTLKEYLISDGRYLLNDDKNSKNVMLSGTWQAGKDALSVSR